MSAEQDVASLAAVSVLERRHSRTTQQKRKQECSDSDNERGVRDGVRWRVVRQREESMEGGGGNEGKRV